MQELRLPLLAPSELATLESQNQHDLLIPVSCGVPRCFLGMPRGWFGVRALTSPSGQVDSIAAAWRSHALRHGSGVPSHLCRPRHGTRPRNHHCHLDPHSK